MVKPVRIIDTHCHLDIAVFQEHFTEIVNRSIEQGVSDFIVPGYVSSNWDHLLEVCRNYSFLHAAPGLHPLYITQHHQRDLERLEEICKQERVVAIGEIGLDLLRDKTSENAQQELFMTQLHMARTFNLPVLIHVRKAHDQVASILRKVGFEGGGIVHAFNGSMQQAEKYLELGFKLGYGGTLTYSRAKKIRSLAAALPLTAIVLETDAPDIPLAQRRDRVNSPEFLPEILDALASLRGEPREEIARQTTKNAQEVLSIR